MFQKKNDKLESLIGAHSDIKGDISLQGVLRIDGTITGNITADWVILGDSASVKGDITAKGVVIGGRVEGTIEAGEIVEIKSKGELLGDIHTQKLSVAEGGIFEGRSFIQKGDSKVIDLAGSKAHSS